MSALRVLLIAMLISCLIALSVGQTQSQPIVLARTFKLGEKAEYKVRSQLMVESRGGALETFIPRGTDINYNFTYTVTKMLPDGIAVLRYKRPTMTEISAETFDSPAKTTVDKTNLDLELTISPINELISMRDLSPKKKTGGSKGNFARGRVEVGWAQDPDDYMQEIYRLALFIGSLDSGMDFSPKLPFDEVKPGDTWKKTVGYQPQKIKDAKGKSAVQRLDYTYTYKGIVGSGSRKYYRISAALALNTDVAEFINQLYKATPEETGLKAIKLTLEANIDFDLDLKTRRTVKAVARSQGSVSILLTEMPDAPALEQRIKGETLLALVSAK